MPLNEIIEEKIFTAEVKKLESQIPRIYEITESISWELARNPKLGTPLPIDLNYRVYESSPLDKGAPKFWVLFEIDSKKEKVYLYSIKLIQEQEE